VLRLIYTLLYYGAASTLMPFEFFKRKKGLKKKWLTHKLGIFKKFKSNRPIIWIHSVSVGETIAVSPLIKVLSKDYQVLISTITDTGFEVAKSRFKDLGVEVIYLPLDCPFAIKRLLKAFSPKALLITETEIWPNLVWETSKFCPVFLINGRLSEKSFKNYKKVKFFVEKVLKSFTAILVQNEIYAKRFSLLGAPKDKIFVVGNLKFDIEIPELEFPWSQNLPSPIVIAGSTHSPEEELILSAFLSLEDSGSLILAPRHPQRFSEVESIVLKTGSKLVKLSELEKSKDFKFNSPVVVLVDKIGILSSLYRIADVVIIGGSFIPHGGQNPLEAIYWKKPVIFGPYMDNFPFVKDFLEKKACIQTDSKNLKKVLSTLIRDEKLRIELGEKAFEVFSQMRGSLNKTLTILKDYLN